MKPEDSHISQPTGPGPAPPSNTGVVDPDVIRELRQMEIPGEPDALAALVKVFKTNAETDLVKLRTAVASLNARDVNRLAHKLKGSCGNFGAKKMAALCQILEKAGYDQKLEEAPVLFEKIEAACVELIDCLTRGLAKD